MSGTCVVGTMVTFAGNVVWVRFGTLREGAGKYVWNTTAGEGSSDFKAGAVGELTVTLEKI